MSNHQSCIYDVGMAAYLLDIENEKQMQRDPLRGHLCENFVVNDLMKDRFNDAKMGKFYFSGTAMAIEEGATKRKATKNGDLFLLWALPDSNGGPPGYEGLTP